MSMISDTRELLDLLERAQLVADKVDAARGRALPDDVPVGPGESRGMDLGEAVAIIAARVRDDVQGATGRE